MLLVTGVVEDFREEADKKAEIIFWVGRSFRSEKLLR